MNKQLIILISLILFYSYGYGKDVFYASGPKDIRQVALTFDDGPGPNTPKVLEILKKYGVRATFFMEGQLVKNKPDLVEQVLIAGHEVGGHSYTHPDFYHYKGSDYKEKLAHEIDKTEEVLKSVGVQTKIMRMPYGYVKDWVKEIAKYKGYILVNWGFGCDWTNKTKEEMAKGYIDNIKPGMIFLLHDGGVRREKTLYLLPILLEEILKKGFKAVTVTEMIEGQ